MRVRKGIIGVLMMALCLALGLGLAACGGGADKYTYALDKTAVALNVGATHQISVTATPEKELDPEYVSENAAIATVSDTGLVTAVAAGSTTVTVTVDEQQLTLAVTVTQGATEYEYMLNKTSLELVEGASQKLVVLVNPEKQVAPTFESAEPSIASVAQDGTVTAEGAGTTTITAKVDGKTLSCLVTVAVPITATATQQDIAGAFVNLNANGNDAGNLYWEHYSFRDGSVVVDAKSEQNDFIPADQNMARALANGFGDYKATMYWKGTGAPGVASTGVHSPAGSVSPLSIAVNVTKDVKSIRLYTGAYQAKNTVALMYNGVAVATAQPIVSESSSVSSMVEFSVNYSKEEPITLQLQLTPSDPTPGGNVSVVAIAVMGGEMSSAAAATTSVSVANEPIVFQGDGKDPQATVDLTEMGTVDWYYANFDHVADSKVGADYFVENSFRVDPVNKDWSYRAAFKWSDGTAYPNSPIDNDCNNKGTNNSVFGNTVTFDVKVDKRTTAITLYLGTYKATGYLAVLDKNGNTLSSGKVIDFVPDASTHAAVTVNLTAPQEDTLTFVFYKQGDNCAFAAAAVSGYGYRLNKTSLTLEADGSETLSVSRTDDGEVGSITWKSSKQSVATVTAEGLVEAKGEGEAIITAEVDGVTLSCEVTVLPAVLPVTAGDVTAADVAGQTIDLEEIVPELDTLYWEHYQNGRTNKKLNAQELVTGSDIMSLPGNFGDYKAKFEWYNGSVNLAWDGCSNGKHTAPNGSAYINVKVNASVKQIVLYTGAWNGSALVTLNLGEKQLAAAEKITADSNSVARALTFPLTVTGEATVTLRITSETEGNGNASVVALAVLGTSAQATTSLSMNKVEMTSADNVTDLTQLGSKDWLYLNYENQGSDEKSGGTAIATEALGDSNKFWDYKNTFTWTDGSKWETNGVDSDNEKGTNNGICGACVGVKVRVEKGDVVHLFTGGWKSTYSIAVIDASGNVIANEVIAQETGDTNAYQVSYTVTESAGEELTFIVYRTSTQGGNCSIAAVALTAAVQA